MIILKKLIWNNILSYQSSTNIQLDKESLIQLVGDNGAGKTTIPLVIQEVLYGKNIKNIKKQDLVNRHSGKKGYYINLTFSKDKDEYKIILDRKSTIKLQLYKNDKEISSHKSLDTYKQIAEIIGIPDFKIFSQLVYQSSTGSLEFLTATDTNRKRFLINLLQLEKYLELHELFKITLRKKINDSNKIEGKIDITKAWITKHEKLSLRSKDSIKLTDSTKQENILEEIVDLKSQIDSIQKTNKEIVNNNQYKEDLNNLKFNPLSIPEHINILELEKLDNDYSTSRAVQTHLKNQLNNLKTEDSICPTCKQIIAAADSTTMKLELLKKIDNLKCEMFLQINIINELKDKNAIYNKWKLDETEFKRLLILIDKNMISETLSKVNLEGQVKEKQKEYNILKNEYNKIVKYNEEVSAHNARIEVITSQLKEYKSNLHSLNKEHNTEKEEVHLLDALKRIFSTNGLVSYKIESSVKELEKTINEYLSEFSHFQIYFILDKDKLNIQVIDEAGEETTVEGLSAGELGRVNIATVLAIRKIMASLTSTEINFLFLDEIVGVLDTNGKEKLTELLLKEKLNTFIVAHEFSNPLVPKLHIIKENNTSRIEYG